MAQSIGELFVKLGFDVDDSKLKSFDESVQSVFQGILKIAGIAGGATAFYEFAKGAEDNAVALRNLNTEMGVHYETAQKFASLWKTVNPTSDINAGLKISAQMAQYASQAFHGIGGAEYAAFGGTSADFIDSRTGQFSGDVAVKNMLARFRSGYGLALSNAQGDQTRVTQFLQEMAGSPDIVNVVNATQEQTKAAETLRDLSQKNVDDTVKAGEAVASLQTHWDNFINHAIATLADAVNKMVDQPKKYANFSDYIKQEGFGGLIRDTLTGGGKTMMGGAENLSALTSIGFQSIFGAQGSGNALARAFIATNGLSGVNPFLPLGLRSHNPGNLMPGGHEAVYPDDGSGLQAMAALLRRYGRNGWNTVDQIVDHWSPASGKGNSAATSSAYKTALRKIFGNQALNLNDPETIGKLMGPMIRQEQGYNPFSPAQIADAAGSTTNNVTINVQSNSSDNAELSRLVHQHFVNATYPTISKAGY